MAKNQFQKPNHTDHKKGDLKKKEKFAIKLKSKLKSAIFNETNKATESLLTEAKTQKSQAKFNIPSAPSTSGIKPKVASALPKPNKVEKKSKPFIKTAGSVNENGTQIGGQKQYNEKGKTNKKVKADQPSVSQTKKNPPSNVNGVKQAEPSPDKVKQKKKKQKQKRKQKQQPKSTQNDSTLPLPPKSTNDQEILNEIKRKVDDVKVNKEIGKKRFKTVGGFVETNANDEEETKLVTEKLKKKKNKKKSELENDPNAPKIKIHNVEESNINGSNSDSEADSYIDKFFGDDGGKFDEDRIYSLDEIEADRENGFLSKASGEVTESDTASSEDTAQVNKKIKKKQKKQKKESSDLENSSPKNKLVSYKEGDDGAEYDFEDYMWPEEDDEESYTESDFDDSDDSNMMYGSDSEISLGSEVIDSDDTYECESTDIESMDEYEDDMSYDGYEEHTSDSEQDHSDYSDYSEEDMSASSGDTYDDFLNSRRYDDDHSSNGDHEYTDSAYDDIRIAQGTAITHKITDERIKLFENDTESRIIEVPKSDSDDDSCVDLIPININKSKFLRMEREKMVIKEEQRKKKLLIEEQKRLAYEKSVEDYYNMDNLNKGTSSEDSFTLGDTVSVIKCPKTFNHSTMDSLEESNDSQLSNEGSDFNYPKVDTTKMVVISIPDPTENKTKPKVNHSKSNVIQSKPKVNQTKQDAVEMDQNFNTSESFNENEELQSGTEEEEEEEVQEDEETSSEPMEITETRDTEPKFFNSVNSRHVLLLLRKTLHFHGSLHVKLIAGKATAFGYELQPNKTVTVHSPRGHGLICLIPTSNTDAAQSNLNELDNLKGDFYVHDLNYLKEEFDSSNDAILLLERDQTNKGVNMIERYMRETVFPNINAFNNESPFYSSEFVLRCKFLNEPANGLVLNEEWLTLSLKDNTKLITIGGKGVGKSTFVRHLVNSNFDKFKKFLFIDLDIGQPELFVPQTLSATVVNEPILGPGYLRNVKPAKAVLFGDINVLPDPIKYWRCIVEIHKFCTSNEEFAKIPWVINTMGYNRGFGSELIACILKIFKPTDLVQIQSRSAMENFEQIMKTDVVNSFKFNVFKNEMKQINGNCKYTTHIFSAARGRGNHKQMDMNAKDIRYTMILAKLGNCLKFNSDWLTSVKPIEASLNDLSVLVTSGEEINPTDYLDLLNGNLVYLCEKRAENENDIVDCHGIGIVRSVDATTNKLYLLSTIPLAELCSVNVLAIGAIPLPSAVFLNQHSQIRGAVPYVYNSDKFVGSKQVAHHIFRAESNRHNKPIKLMEE